MKYVKDPVVWVSLIGGVVIGVFACAGKFGTTAQAWATRFAQTI